MRLFKISMMSVLALFFVSTTASAIEFSVISTSGTTIAPGGSITINIALDNAAGQATQGITATIAGLASAGAVATSGQSASAHFVGFCSPSNCFGGIDTVNNPFYNPLDLSASGAYTAGDDTIVIVNALALSPTSLAGALDPGLDGGLNAASARDITIVLAGFAPGVHELVIGGEFSDGATVLPITSTATLTVTVVPEPGTALLMGLGLTGLAAAGRRSRN